MKTLTRYQRQLEVPTFTTQRWHALRVDGRQQARKTYGVCHTCHAPLPSAAREGCNDVVSGCLVSFDRILFRTRVIRVAEIR